MGISFLEKPALAMDLEDFVNGLNAEIVKNKKVAHVLSKYVIDGKITKDEALKIKSHTFNSVGTLTLEGLMDIFSDLKKVGLSRHATIKGYMSRIDKAIGEKVSA